MKIKPFAFSFIVALFISFIFLIATFWIFYKYSGNISSAKDAFSATGSYFGAVATLGVALVAAYLFTDWRIIENHAAKNDQINKAISAFIDLQTSLKLKSILLLNASRFCITPEISFMDKVQLLYDIHEIQQEVSYSLRNIKIYIQVYANISNDLELCDKYEKTLDSEEVETAAMFADLVASIDKNSPPQEVFDLYQMYYNHLTGPLISRLHSKIIIELSGLAKALT